MEASGPGCESDDGLIPVQGWPASCRRTNLFVKTVDRVGEGGLSPPEPERGRGWEPFEGSHLNREETRSAVCCSRRMIRGGADRRGKQSERHTMRRTTLALSVMLATAALAAGLGLGARFAPHAAAQSSAAPPAVTPKTQVPQEARALSQAFAATARALRPSVVRIDVEIERPKLSRRDFQRDDLPPDMERFFEHFFHFGDNFEGLPMPGPGRGTGSGVVIDGAGNIMTNSHVAEKASKVTVIFADGREFSAKVVGADPRTDVAVIRLQNPPSGLVAARLGDSNAIEVGEWVLAIGSPLGLDQSVTAGIIRGKGKVTRNVHMSGERMREYIQTDAKINPGNSGGPLVNLSAEVVGINTLINTGPGGAYGFAIPINQVRLVAESLLKDGRVHYPYLGVVVGDVGEAEAANLKKRVGSAPPGGGA